MPYGASRHLTGPGTSGRYLAIEHVSQDGPPTTAVTCLWRIFPIQKSTFTCFIRSPLLPDKTSSEQNYHLELSRCKERIDCLLEIAWSPPRTEHVDHEDVVKDGAFLDGSIGLVDGRRGQVNLGGKLGNVFVSGAHVEDELPEHRKEGRDNIYRQDADRVPFVFGEREEGAQHMRGLLGGSSRKPSALALMQRLECNIDDRHMRKHIHIACGNFNALNIAEETCNFVAVFQLSADEDCLPSTALRLVRAHQIGELEDGQEMVRILDDRNEAVIDLALDDTRRADRRDASTVASIYLSLAAGASIVGSRLPGVKRGKQQNAEFLDENDGSPGGNILVVLGPFSNELGRGLAQLHVGVSQKDNRVVRLGPFDENLGNVLPEFDGLFNRFFASPRIEPMDYNEVGFEKGFPQSNNHKPLLVVGNCQVVWSDEEIPGRRRRPWQGACKPNFNVAKLGLRAVR